MQSSLDGVDLRKERKTVLLSNSEEKKEKTKSRNVVMEYAFVDNLQMFPYLEIFKSLF